MNRSIIVCLLIAVFLQSGFLAEAQQAGKIPRIGYLVPRSALEPRDEAFRQGLGDLGYVEGKNIIIELRLGKQEELSKLAAELVGLKVDLIVAPGSPPALAAKAATRTIPIVFSVVADPVDAGFVTSLARPGGNMTGLTPSSAELSAKRLELLKESVPTVSRIAVLSSPTVTYFQTEALNEMEATARALGVQLQLVEVRGHDDFDRAFGAIKKERAEAFTVLPAPIFLRERRRIVDFAAKNRLPAIFHWTQYVEAGGLMSYGPDGVDLYRRAATYVDKILKGANPAELPVERARKFELVINLKTAKQIGLKIPPEVLYRADKVIK